jgi:type II secretory pathway pseudopilin PulG
MAEVLIVVAIIAVLVAIAIPVFTGQLEKNRDSITATNLRAAYDEANATLLSRGQKPSDGATVTVDGVDYRSTDNSLSGETLPFALGNGLPSGAGIYSLEFRFNKDTATVMTWSGEASGSGSGTIPAPMSPPPTAEQKPTLEDISVTNFKDNYLEGESFDKSDMVVKAIYSDGNESTVTSYSCSNVGPYPIAGSYTVKVSYQGITKELTITVNKRTVEWIKITDGPDKDEYTEGEEFKPDGMVVTARFSDDSADSEPHIIPATDYICRPASGDVLTASVTCVTVSYEGQMDTWPITVGGRILKGITVDGAEFEEGETFDQSKLIVTANYDNARPKTVSISDCEILDLPTFSNPLQRDETYSFTVKYTEGEGEDLQEASADVTFTVKKAPLTGISVVVADDYYHVGDRFSKSGLTVTATYDNAFIDEYSEDISAEAYSLDPALDSEDAPTLEERDYEVEVSYTERGETKTAPATFTVTDSTLTGLTVVVKDTVTYYVGDTVKKTDLTVTATYENEHTKVLDDDAYILVNNTPLVKGTNTISVTYQEKPASTELTVDYAALKGITVGIAKYYVGDTFNESDVTVTATYANNDYCETITSGYTVTLNPNDVTLQEREYEVTVTYNEKPYKATFDVTYAAVVSIDFQFRDLDSTTSFSKDNLLVTATYANGHSDTISTGYTYTLYPNHDPLQYSTTYRVTVTYQDPGVPSKSHNFTTPANPDNGGGIPCFAPGTLITLADGTRKPIEELAFDDMLLVWDFKTGTYDAQPAVLLIDHGEDTHDVIGLHFSDGALLRIVGEHGVFDYDLNRFVYISPENVADYIGHRFVKCVPEGGYDLVTLDSVEISVEQITALSIVSSYDFNVFASDLLTMTPSPVAGSFDLMPMGETLRYDMDQFQKNVAEFGTYDYEVFAQYVTEEQFEAVNGAYMKILVESGVLSFEELCELAVFFTDFMN